MRKAFAIAASLIAAAALTACAGQNYPCQKFNGSTKTFEKTTCRN